MLRSILVALLAIGFSTMAVTAQSGRDEPAPLGAAERRTVMKFMLAKYGEAKQHFDSGRYQLAYRVADSILTLTPDAPFRQDVRSLRRAAEARHLGETVIAVGLKPDAPTSFPVEKVSGQFELENLSDEISRIEATEGLPMGMCQFRVFEVYEDGSHWASRGSRVIRSPGSFSLNKGESRSQFFQIDLQRGVREPILQLIEIRGSFRPTELASGDETIARSIPWNPVDIVALPEDYRSIEVDPRSELAKALEALDSGRVAAAGFLWARELVQQGDLGRNAREETIALLMSQISAEAERPLDRLVMRLLEEVSGVEQRPTRDIWLRWYRGRKKS